MFFSHHLFQHAPYSLTRFHRCQFLTRQISLGVSSGSHHPTPGSPCHHGNGCVRTDVPHSLPYFPASVEFWMQILRWGEKKPHRQKHFLQLLSVLLKSRSEGTFLFRAEGTYSGQRWSGKPEGVRCTPVSNYKRSICFKVNKEGRFFNRK